MIEIKKKQFAVLCYNVLMDGYEDKSLGYMVEKTAMLTAGFDAYSFLDPFNQGRVLLYLKHKNYSVPLQIMDYHNSMVAELIK